MLKQYLQKNIRATIYIPLVAIVFMILNFPPGIEAPVFPVLNLTNEYLKLILQSWPAVVLIVIIIFFKQIRELIPRIKQLPGGTKFFEEKKPSVHFLAPEEPKFDSTPRQREGTALVSCKIASVLPNSVTFDFLKDWKVWFWIANHETKKYQAYVKIKFITKDYERELREGYYGGKKPWKLNALSAIQAPGLGIPEEIKEATKQKKKIEIQIYCNVMDENNKLIEKKLPIGYVYNYENDSWYLEP